MPVRILNRFHKKQPEGRPSANQRGYTYRWQQYRLHYLTQHPLCCECLKTDVLKAATDVDHIQPVSGADDPRFYDESNHQPLCSKHHKAKSAREGASGTGRDSRGQAMRHSRPTNTLRIQG